MVAQERAPSVDGPELQRKLVVAPDLRQRAFRSGLLLRAGILARPGCGFGWARATAEADLFFRQRSVDERLLLAVGRGHDVVADVGEQEPDLEAGGLDILQQRRGERAVASRAVACGRAVARRVGDQDVVGRLHAGQPALDHARDPGHQHPAQERIVAAGIEDDKSQSRGVRDRPDHGLETDGLVRDVEVGCELGVDRDHPVLPGHLDPMAGEEDDRQLGAAGPAAEIDQGAAQVVVPGIGQRADGIAEPRQRRGHVAGVIDRIRQERNVLVGAVADDEGDARLGAHALAADQQRQKHRADQSREPQALPRAPTQGRKASSKRHGRKGLRARFIPPPRSGEGGRAKHGRVGAAAA